MAMTNAQRLARLKIRLDELKYWRAREEIAVTGWTIDGAPIAIGGAWPDRQGAHKFAATAEVPEHWPVEETRLVLDLGGESLVTLSYPNRDSVSFGVDPYHREFPVRHRQIAISAEATAREPFGVPVRAPKLNRAVLQWIDGPVHRFQLLLEAGSGGGRRARRSRGCAASAHRGGDGAARARLAVGYAELSRAHGAPRRSCSRSGSLPRTGR